MTPILRGEDPHYEEGVKAILEEAQENGLDPKRIYQCAVNPNSVITRRIPAWEKVKPDATDEPPTTGAPKLTFGHIVEANINAKNRLRIYRIEGI